MNNESAAAEAQPGSAARQLPIGEIEVVAPNFKRRLSGVTSTIIQLLPLQARMLGIASLGPGLPDHLPKLRWWQVPGLLVKPQGRPFRIWHARRNPEMLGGIVLKHVFRAPLRLVFTSASQRDHTRYTRWLIRRMDAVIATSRKTASYLQVPNIVIMHGVDADRFSPPIDKAASVRAVGLDPAQKYVGCFGRVRHQKGTDLFVDAMIRLLPSRPQWSAIIAGRTTPNHQAFEDELRRRIAAAGLSDRIIFVGEQKEIPLFYRALTLFVAPQRWEGFGLTPLEAMASAVPVVAADVGAFSEVIVPEKTGTIVPPDDPDALVAAVAPWMDDGARREQGARAALELVRAKFRLQGEAEKILGVYEGLWQGERA
jgi:mannosyltransferase